MNTSRINKLIGATAAVLLMAGSGIAVAQTGSTTGTTSSGTAATAQNAQSATGTVSKIDRSGHTLTMQDGTKYKLSSNADVARIKEGDQVRVQYQTQGSDRMAMQVTPATGSAGSSSSTTGSGSSGMSGSTGTSPSGTQQKQ